ncbi:MAG: hypothetical protein JW910_08200 [Anaerolineae bacterium]|nr:hypothetical protein [Anaerolineae bacterium]
MHLWTLGNESTLTPERACYWYAARGLAGQESSLVEDDWRKWNRQYGAAIQKLLENYVRASGGRPLTVISAWYAPEYLRQICGTIDRAFGDSADYVFVGPEKGRLQDLAGQFNGTSIVATTEDILHGVAQNITSGDRDFPPVAGLPGADGLFRILTRPTLTWLSEDMDVLHSSIELETVAAENSGRDFLRGKTIGFHDLDAHYDADRDKTSHILEMVKRELNSRTPIRLNLYHWPGAGGTTVARRMAWELRRQYPVVFLRRVVAGETIGRFREIFNLTGLPVLAIVEGADILSDRLEHLYTDAKVNQVPIIMLSVLRRFEMASDGSRNVFLGQDLSLLEARRFADKYARFATPEVSQMLEEILRKPARERNPFQFALTTFGKEYEGITSYVESRLNAANPDQRRIITFLSLAYYYGHKPVFSQVFAANLGLPENRLLRLERILAEPQLELLVQEADCLWRPIHQLVAEEVIQIVLTGGKGDRRNWKRNLPTWSLEFIKACRSGTQTPNEELLDLMRRVFIFRDENELLGTESSGQSKFSALIEDVITDEGRLSIFKELTDSFPDEAHFWGHLGRFYSVMGEYEKAIDALERATALAPNDSTLHHMLGMAHRKLAYDRMVELQKQRDEAPTQEDIADLQATVEAAKDAFAVARDLNPDSEHPYVSPIQLLLRVLDFGYKLSNCKTRAEFLTASESAWYREQLDETENLMDRVTSIREGEKLSQYVRRCQADLEMVYDNYARALEGWNNLLTQGDVYAPPIRRQIVRAYLSRHSRDWSDLKNREIERIVDLMEDNLREEPGSEHNIRMWFRAIRYSDRQNIDIALDRLAHWKALGDARETYFYLYVLHVLKAIDGSAIERVKAADLIELSRQRSRFYRERTRSYEWFGSGEGLAQLVHYTELGEWEEGGDFYTDTSRLEQLEGRVSKINGPEAGTIELASCGLTAFFVPARAQIEKGRDENARVRFFLGFSYDGLRAWSVEVI